MDTFSGFDKYGSFVAKHGIYLSARSHSPVSAPRYHVIIHAGAFDIVAYANNPLQLARIYRDIQRQRDYGRTVPNAPDGYSLNLVGFVPTTDNNRPIVSYWPKDI